MSRRRASSAKRWLVLAIASGGFGVGVIALHTWRTFLQVPNAQWQMTDLALFIAGPTSVLASLWLFAQWWAARGTPD